MNCPGCGRFMRLENAFELGRDVGISAFWWRCTNHLYCPVSSWSNYIPAPEYDWLWWWADVSEEEATQAFAEMPGLEDETNEMRRQYENRKR